VRFLHTSDWHLGRSFHQVGLLEAQARFLDHLVDTVRQEKVDAVLVSGDVYDRAMPAPDTVQLLSEALTRLIDAGAQVVLSSGNHDSAIRLGFAADLLARAGLHIRCSAAEVGRPVMVGGVAVYPVPYLEPALAAPPMAAAERTHAAVLRAAMERVHADRAARGAPSVVMSHAFVTGAATSDSERDISVGGVSAVPPAVFDGVDYVALGHLHRRQLVSDSTRYCGSPLALSFSEWDQRKGSWLVDLTQSGVAVQAVESPVARPLRVLRGELDALLRDPGLSGAEGAWCQVTLTDAVRPIGAMDRIRRRFPHTLVLQFDPPRGPVDVVTYAARVTARSDVEVCCDFLTHVRSGAGPSDQERDLFEAALESGRLCRAARDETGRTATAPARAGAA
jgi:exonuclease SbcD